MTALLQSALNLNRKRAWLILSGLATLLLFYLLTPDPTGREPLSTVLLDRQGQLMGARLAADGQWRFASADSIPFKYRSALLAFEDKRFYLHPGIDPLALLRAFAQNIRAQKIVSGGSTITMQLARISTKYGQRKLRNKLAEALMALKIELKYSKRSILRQYAAVAPFGGNIAGLEAASWRYFGHPPQMLSWAEAALLAVLPNAPAEMHPGKNRQLLLEKRNRLLKKLHNNRLMSSTDLELALLEPIPEKNLPFPDLAPHYLEDLRKTGKTGTIKSTLDPGLQLTALNLAENYRLSLSPAFINNLAVVIRNVEHHEVLAYVGNLPPSGNIPGAHNDMAKAMRSPGSILKPLLFAAALDEGLINTESLLPDIPMWWGSFSPRNFDNSFSGAVRASEALQRSLNVPFAWLLKEYGIEKFRLLLRQLGFSGLDKSASHYGISLILGGAEINLLELTYVYARLARKARDPDFDFPLSHEACRLTAEVITGLNRPETEATLFPETGELQLAWKTGTSFGLRDAWALGFNPNYVIGVWVGNADGSGRPGLTGASAAGPLLFDLAFQLLRFQTFYQPLSQISQYFEVCSISGYSPGPDCPTKTITGTAGRSQVKTCAYHKTIETDLDSQWQIVPGCNPPFGTIRQTWFVLPPLMGYYYAQRHSDYKPLPPTWKGCDTHKQAAMDFAYPPPNALLYLPRNFEGKIRPAVFVVMHQNPEAKLYWHLNGRWLGTTTGPEHRMPVIASAGDYNVTAVDENGESITRRVRFVNPSLHLP